MSRLKLKLISIFSGFILIFFVVFGAGSMANFLVGDRDLLKHIIVTVALLAVFGIAYLFKIISGYYLYRQDIFGDKK